jgi:hypothetical protein
MGHGNHKENTTMNQTNQFKQRKGPVSKWRRGTKDHKRQIEEKQQARKARWIAEQEKKR